MTKEVPFMTVDVWENWTCFLARSLRQLEESEQQNFLKELTELVERSVSVLPGLDCALRAFQSAIDTEKVFESQPPPKFIR